MKIVDRFFEEAFVLEAEPVEDQRGSFTRLYCENELREITGSRPVVQINHAHTHTKGVVRGLHFQRLPKKETKIIRCIRGSLFNVIVDLRAGSPTFLQWQSHVLSQDNKRLIYIPYGFAHGSQILENDTELIMFHTDFYSKAHEAGIRYNEPLVGVNWPLPVNETELSEKDRVCGYLDKNYQGIDINSLPLRPQ
jgi:dTDP-4-dehydrorhamnose 3,5-epimerase